jgi:hypothetical protein
MGIGLKYIKEHNFIVILYVVCSLMLREECEFKSVWDQGAQENIST